MRRMYQSRGLVAALEEENLVPEDQPVEQADNANSLETDLIEVADAQAEQAEAVAQVEEAAETAEALESIADRLQVAAQNGGIDKHAAAALESAVNHIYRSVGISNVRAMPALESFGGASSRIGATTLALEDIKEQAKKVWDAIVAAIMKSIAWIKEQYSKVFGAAQKMEKRAAALAKRAQAVEGQPKEKTIENERLVKALFMKGSVPNLAQAAQAVQDVANTTFGTFSQTNSKIGEAIAELMESGEPKDGGLKALEDLAGKPQNFQEVANPESEGFQKPADGVGIARSIELPGGKAIICKHLLSSAGEESLRAFSATGSSMGDFNPKAKAPSKNTLTVMSGADAAKVAEIVEKLASEIISFEASIDKISKIKDRISKAAGKLGSAASKEEDAGKRDYMKSMQKIAGSVPRLLDQPAFGFSAYALNTGKSLLDAVAESLKQYA